MCLVECDFEIVVHGLKLIYLGLFKKMQSTTSGPDDGLNGVRAALSRQSNDMNKIKTNFF